MSVQWPPDLLQLSETLKSSGIDVSQLLHHLKPTGIADYASLALISSTSAFFLSRGILWDQPDPLDYLNFERPQLKNGGPASGPQETRNIAQKLDETGKDIVVFWGSQSGTAEGFAKRLAREIGMRFGKETMTADLSDYDPPTIAQIPGEKLAIFILSTYGEGDPSDNTGEFWDWVTKARTGEVEASLEYLRYVAFGLGNSNYKFYNRVVDVVVDALGQLKAQAIMPVAKANDAQGATQEDFMAWKDNLFAVFKNQLGFHESEPRYLPILQVDEDPSLEPIDLYHGEPNQRESKTSSPVRVLSVANSRELFNASDRHCLHMELDLTSQPELTYKTGDHLAVWPSNPDIEVDLLLQVLGLSDRRQTPISIKSLDPATTKITIPTPTTPEALVRYYLEICASVNRDTVLGLAQFAPTPEAKAQLLRLGQDKAAYADLLNRNYITLGRLLRLISPDHTWSSIPLSFIVESLPPLQARYYSISSSSVLAPRKPSITVLVSSTPVPENPDQFIHGVTSNYLLAIAKPDNHPYGLTYPVSGPNNTLAGAEGAEEERKVFAHLRRTRFKLPFQAAVPIIMIAAGTGLAPFRAFIAERRQMRSIGKPIGEMILFFGCRSPEEDFIYREELEALAGEGSQEGGVADVLRIVTAFSRYESGGEKRRYVQDRVGECSDDVVRLLDQGANLYICGRAAMAREVEKVVGDEMKRAKGWDENGVNEWTKAIKKKNKWQEDVWG